MNDGDIPTTQSGSDLVGDLSGNAQRCIPNRGMFRQDNLSYRLDLADEQRHGIRYRLGNGFCWTVKGRAPWNAGFSHKHERWLVLHRGIDDPLGERTVNK